MEHLNTPNVLAVALCLFIGVDASAQCTPATSTVTGPVLRGSIGLGGTENRTGIAFNPVAGLYYSVNAGSGTYPVDTYDASYNLVDSIAQGYDYRGAWWNPLTSQFQGNGYSGSGIFVQSLAGGTQHPLGTGSVLLSGPQPDAQACAAFDSDANEIVYYFSGSIYRYSGATNTALGSFVITGLPVPTTSINSTGIAYTGCPGHEYGIYNFVDQRLLFIDKATGAYSGACQLPITAPLRDYMGTAFANDMFWVFDDADFSWHGYNIVATNVGLEESSALASIVLAPNPASDELTVSATGSLDNGSLDIFDATGRLVLSTMLSKGSLRIDVSGLSNGTYHARLLAGTATVQKTFMIAR
ncbi:MAG: T9SS type A sorting domain-containing protein [Flavobacteriales bacterium]